MEFFNSAVDVLKTLVVALGAGLGVWGAVTVSYTHLNFAISTAKLSARTLLRGAQFFLRQYDKSADVYKRQSTRSCAVRSISNRCGYSFSLISSWL